MEVGDVLGRWTLLYPGRNAAGKKIWLCRCRCLTIREVLSGNLTRRVGASRGCGCYLNEERRLNRAQARYESPQSTGERSEYGIWKGMYSRCFNPKDIGFKRYGGRGITVCQRWLESFDAFFADVGPRPSPAHTLDRIDNDGNYEPGNVRWATRVEQGRNTSTNRLVTYKRETHSLMDWCRLTGMKQGTLWGRLKHWTVERALTEPLGLRPPQLKRQIRALRWKRGHTSRFRGVSLARTRYLSKPWSVSLCCYGQRHYLGRYTTEEEAARAYDHTVLKLLGPTATLNFPGEEESIA